jgi:hypothetical protein
LAKVWYAAGPVSERRNSISALPTPLVLRALTTMPLRRTVAPLAKSG